MCQQQETEMRNFVSFLTTVFMNFAYTVFLPENQRKEGFPENSQSQRLQSPKVTTRNFTVSWSQTVFQEELISCFFPLSHPLPPIPPRHTAPSPHPLQEKYEYLNFKLLSWL